MPAAPLHLALDLDRTLVEEVPLGRYGSHSEVQALTYLPSDEKRDEYRDLEAASPDAPRYRFHPDGTVTVGLVARPAFGPLLACLAPRVARGAAVVLVVSKNERARTEAVIAGIRVGGSRLADIGARYVPKASWRKRGKDLALLRASLAIPAGADLVAVDDAPGEIRNPGPRDRVFGVAPWDPDAVAAHLEGGPGREDWRAAEEAAFRRLAGVLGLWHEAGSRPQPSPKR